MVKQFSLPNLPYAYDELEPIISAEIMQLHHQKHHAAYVNNLNTAFQKSAQAAEEGDLDTVISLQGAIRFNGGGHINHALFWENLAPIKKGGGVLPTGLLEDALNVRFGSLEKFIEQFNAQTAPIQGSGWGWLCWHKEAHHLCIHTCANQDPLFATTAHIPLLGIDVWEHAYYLQYKNARLDYLKNIWKIVNWSEVEKRYAKCIKN